MSSEPGAGFGPGRLHCKRPGRRLGRLTLAAWSASGSGRGDRYGARYSWAVFAISCLAILPVWLFSAFVVVAVEESDRYVEAIPVAVGAVLVIVYVSLLPGVGQISRAAMSPAASGGRTVEPLTEEDFWCAT